MFLLSIITIILFIQLIYNNFKKETNEIKNNFYCNNENKILNPEEDDEEDDDGEEGDDEKDDEDEDEDEDDDDDDDDDDDEDEDEDEDENNIKNTEAMTQTEVEPENEYAKMLASKIEKIVSEDSDDDFKDIPPLVSLDTNVNNMSINELNKLLGEISDRLGSYKIELTKNK